MGAALVRCFAGAGMQVVAAARNAERASALLSGTGARAYGCDATDEAEVEALFARVAGELGPPSLVVHNPSHFVMQPVLDLAAEEFVQAWRVACLGAAACLLMPTYYVTPSSGHAFVLVAFTIVVLGGMGSFVGAAVGGLVIGVTESLGGLFLGLLENVGIWQLPSEWQSAISFGVFLLFIVLRPRGFFGRKVQSAEL